MSNYTLEDAARARGTTVDKLDLARVTPYEFRRIAESTGHPYCLNCGDTYGQHSPDPDVHPCDEWSPSTMWPARVVIRKDFDGKWASTWPPEIVRAGLSAGAGRHETQAALVAAIEAKGYRVERATRRSLLVTATAQPTKGDR